MKRVVLALILSMHCAIVLAQAASEGFASKAIDTELFKEGEVRRVTAQYNNWQVVCDEIIRQKKRFCSLSSIGKDANGKNSISIIVSTSDDGSPAALIRLPFGISLRDGVELITPKAKNIKLQNTTKLIVPHCDAQGCMTILSLKPPQIEALNRGDALHVQFSMVQSPNIWREGSINHRTIVVDAVIDGTGFKQAIEGSMTMGNKK